MPWRTNTLTEYKQNEPCFDTVLEDGYQLVEFAESSEQAAGSSDGNLFGATSNEIDLEQLENELLQESVVGEYLDSWSRVAGQFSTALGLWN